MLSTRTEATCSGVSDGRTRRSCQGVRPPEGWLPVSIVPDFTCSRARPDPDFLMALRAAGCPVQEIAERIGQSRASAYRWLVRYGIPRRAVTLGRGAHRTRGDRGPWLATPDLLALWEDRKPDLESIARRSGSRPSAIRERLITAGALPVPQSEEGYSTPTAAPSGEPSRGRSGAPPAAAGPCVGLKSLPVDSGDPRGKGRLI